MEAGDAHQRPAKRPRLTSPEPGEYVLRSVLDDIPLNADGAGDEVSITCVEYWNGNLYIGTSASEILHLVSIPPETDGGGDDDGPPTFILASRLQPSGHDAAVENPPGIQQILVFPGPLKACVLCNGTASFYSLPEFTPAFPNREPTGVQWIGGIDENEDIDNPEGPVIMVANSKRILQVRVGERLRPVRNNIEYPGCLKSSRRETIACVADESSYALVEVEHQQKIPLFPISTLLDEDASPQDSAQSPDKALSGRDERSPTGHGRSTSMGTLLSSSTDKRRDSRDTQHDARHLSPPTGAPAGAGGQSSSARTKEGSVDRPTSRPRSSTETLPARPEPSPTPARGTLRLKPHILTPFPTEFLLTTGTSEMDPGVAMFVNLDGEVSRGTIEFETYPLDLLVDNFPTPEMMAGQMPAGEGHVVVALMREKPDQGSLKRLQFQPIENASGSSQSKSSLVLPPDEFPGARAGLHRTLNTHSYSFKIVGELLRLVPLMIGPLKEHKNGDPRTKAAVEQLEQEQALFESQSLPTPVQTSAETIAKRSAEELKLAQRLGKTVSKNTVWHGKKLSMILQNPLISQLEYRLMQNVPDGDISHVKAPQILGFLASIHGREPMNETEFLTLSFIRQKAGLILYLHLLTQFESKSLEDILRPVENTLHDGGLDPRVVLLLTPPLSHEVLYGPEGIWLSQGMSYLASDFIPPTSAFEDGPIEFWMMIRHFLMLWQEKRGYGSITDEKHVFDSVDAALLHVLLYLDQTLPADSGAQKSVHIKLNNVVDHWKGDYERAIQLLERYNRLFALSRLYQSKKQSRAVLNTWKRIIEGEKDFEYSSNLEYVEDRLRRYLAVLRDADLVQEYALYLAQRNPALGVEVLTDSSARVKFDPVKVVPLLKEHAPFAVQEYLEHLVFSAHLTQYADDLIGYFLDSVLTVLESSDEARKSLSDSYATYRALETPKPTYLDFITHNAPKDSWWQSRLRLLQLLGTSSATGTDKNISYSVETVLERLAPFSQYLVSESIILDARQGRHKEALRLLTHGLGDFDTAIRYCYFGGPSPSQSSPVDASTLPSREAQVELFNFLFSEFLSIKDVEDRLERTSFLVGKFATFFDPLEILAQIPDDWSVELLKEFLVRSFRQATTERNQAVIMKALSAAQNLQAQVEVAELCEKMGATWDKGAAEGSKQAPVDVDIDVS